MKILLKLSIVLFALFSSFIVFCYYKYSIAEPYAVVLKQDIEPQDIKEYDSATGTYKAFVKYGGPNRYIFSVIVPVHNVEAYLEKCLESVLVQYYKDYEIIMVENNSTDESLKIAERYAKAYDNIRLIVQDKGSIGGARNTGINAAKGEYITFLDSDDYLNYGALKDAAQTLSSSPVDVVIYNYDKVHFSTGQKLSYKRSAFPYNQVLESDVYSPFDITERMMLTVWRIIFKRSLLKDNDLFFLTNIAHEDVLYLMNLFTEDFEFYARDKSFLSYRVMRPNSVLSKGGHVNDVFTLLDKLKEHLAANGMLDQNESKLLNLENKLLKASFRGLSINESMMLLHYMRDRYNSKEHIEEYGKYDLTEMQYYNQYNAFKNGGFWYWVRKIAPNQLEFEIKRFAFGLL